VQNYLHEGSPELDIERDARWEERERLSFLELLDILSGEEMSSLKPNLLSAFVSAFFKAACGLPFYLSSKYVHEF
jgi:hypothetical protein